MAMFIGLETKIVAMLVTMHFLFSCSSTSQGPKNSSFEHKIGQEINRLCSVNSNCNITIESVTPFQWDTLYVFDYGAERDLIERIVGLSVDVPNDISRKLIFVNNGELVFLETNKSDIERRVQGEVFFTDTDKKNYAVYKPGSIFSARITGRSFEVTCTNCK